MTGIDTIDPTYYTPGMAMGRRKDRAWTPGLWIAANESNELPTPGGHPFYQRVNQDLEAQAFDDFVEAQCAPVFTWILQVLATADLIKGKTIGIDATTLEANAALRSIVRRDSGETYHEFLTRLAQASGIETPTRADLARLDRKRPKKGRNIEWRHPHDPDARITKMKDGRTHLAHKAEHAVDLETGRGTRGRALQRRRIEWLERPNAHLYETGGMRRTHLRGHANILKRLLVHSGGFNLGLLMRTFIGVGTPRGLQGRLAALRALWTHVSELRRDRPTPDADHAAGFTPHHRFERFPINVSGRSPLTTGC